MNRPKLIRVTTVPVSLAKLLKGQLNFMSAHFDVIGISSEGKHLEQVEREEGVPVVSIPFERKLSPFSDIKCLFQLYKIFKKERPDIVHSHTPKAGTLSMIAAKLAGVPVRLHTVAGLPLMESTGMKKHIFNSVEKLTYSCATKVYPNSSGLKDFILSAGFTHSAKVKVLGSGSSNGVDTEFFAPGHLSGKARESFRSSLGIEPEDRVFVFVGRLVSDKGINELVAAYTDLIINTPNTKLLLVGGQEQQLDPLHPYTLSAMEQHSEIILAGQVEDVRPYLEISDVLVFPSYREGFPNAVLQAASMGLPCIVSDINGCNEIIEHEENGLIIPVKEAEPIRQAMYRCLADDELLETMKNNARISVERRYKPQHIWNLLLEEYRQFLPQYAWNPLPVEQELILEDK